MLINIYLIAVMIVMLVMIFIASLYILVYFQHPEDRLAAWVSKIVVMVALETVGFIILLLPIDVANSGWDGNLPMTIIYQVVFFFVGILTVCIVPYFIIYYESEGLGDFAKVKQIAIALTITIVIVVITVVVTVVSWIFLGWVRIDIKYYQAVGGFIDDPNFRIHADDMSVDIFTSLFVYTIALMVLVGWVFFIFFGGIGLSAIPMDLINYWRLRPSQLELQEYAERKIRLRDDAERLLEIGKTIQGRGTTKKQMRVYHRFKKNVFELEDDFKTLEAAYKRRGKWRIKYWISLILGIVTAVVSIIWICHIVLYLVLFTVLEFFNIYPNFFLSGLNVLFVYLDYFFTLFGAILYGIFAFYLLWAVLKGVIKVGVRFFFFPIHPMKVHGTMMNSFLFNCQILLLSSVAIIQFCTLAFDQYVNMSAADTIMGFTIYNLRYINILFQLYPFGILISAAVAFVLLAIYPFRPAIVKKALGE